MTLSKRAYAHVYLNYVSNILHFSGKGNTSRDTVAMKFIVALLPWFPSSSRIAFSPALSQLPEFLAEPQSLRLLTTVLVSAGLSPPLAYEFRTTLEAGFS